MNFPSKLKLKVQDRINENFYRSLSSNFDNKLIDYSSNDYLGLSRNKISHDSRLGATGSRLLSGNYKEIEQLERYIADFHNVESSLVFNSGYTANLGLISSVPQRNDVILYDQEVHASIRDGIKLSNAKNFALKHNNLTDLEEKIEKHKSSTIYIVVETVYSISGDSPDLIAINNICKNNNAYLIVDEAHSFGISGINGSGLVNSLNIEQDIFARVVTYGKALGCHGAAILCSNELSNYLINFCRPFIYTTAPSPNTIETINQQYLKLKESNNERENLFKNKRVFIEKLDQSIKYTTGDYSAIVSIIIGNNTTTKNLATTIQKKGFDVKPILSPTITKGKECIRICFHSFNTKKETLLLAELINNNHEG